MPSPYCADPNPGLHLLHREKLLSSGVFLSALPPLPSWVDFVMSAQALVEISLLKHETLLLRNENGRLRRLLERAGIDPSPGASGDGPQQSADAQEVVRLRQQVRRLRQELKEEQARGELAQPDSAPVLDDTDENSGVSSSRKVNAATNLHRSPK